MQTESYLLWSLRDAPGQQTLKAFQPHGPLPSASVKASVRGAAFPAPIAAAAASAATTCEPAAPTPSTVVQRLDFSQPSSQDKLHIQQDGAEHASVGQDRPEQQRQHSYVQANPAVRSEFGTAGLFPRSASQNDLQLAASLSHGEYHHPLHELQQRRSQHRDLSVQQHEASVQLPANASACCGSSPHQVAQLGGCSVNEWPPGKKQRLDNAASAATAAAHSHPEQSAGNKETRPDVLQHGRQHGIGCAGTCTPAHSHDAAERRHQEETDSQQPGCHEDNAEAEQCIGFDYDSCLDEQPGDERLPEDLQQANVGDDQPNEHHAASAQALDDLQHHQSNHQPAFAAQCADDVALRRGTVYLSGVSGDPPQQAAACHGGQAALKNRMPASEASSAAICQAQPPENGEQPGAAAVDDAGMARARRLAAAARASCDVLRGPVR